MGEHVWHRALLTLGPGEQSRGCGARAAAWSDPFSLRFMRVKAAAPSSPFFVSYPR
ncbi:hypothetical protein GCM10007874_25960 [Labrys miyagiensis]|uniref:Uncharacterized protein n=1 Tax=Labrys miyagiensis TaxID=346912 RepID=A0ABQ6CIK6_9HYPH|nr:hypothetical protein GCM10007874_25960 [Labrys miyagiensis]